MKAKEALHEISTMVFRNTDNFEMRISKECYKNIVNALEKQIPKKPIITIDGFFNGQPIYDTWACPNCGKVNETDFEDYEYCPICGQSLDWTDHPTEKGGEADA